MNNNPDYPRQNPLIGLGILAGATILASISARDYAGSWNDGSRLATVECLVDYHTLAIDRSIFVAVPSTTVPGTPLPYQSTESALLQAGTGDKLYIQGHFYSDKSPVPALLLAAVYKIWQTCTGWTAQQRPDLFCRVMTLSASGLAFVLAVWSVFLLAWQRGLRLSMQLGITVSFALSTIALCYTCHVNNHVLLLGVVSPLLLALAKLPTCISSGSGTSRCVAGIGCLAGLGYTIDLGVGPVVLAGTLLLVLYRCRRFVPLGIFLSAALPWLVLHHVVNFAVGGTFGPANAVAAYFQWPGCPFTPQNMTGSWAHHSLAHFVTYALAMLAGKHGFLGHNLALFMVLPALGFFVLQRPSEWPEIVYAACLSGGVWMAYAMNSNNYSGQCCSIRWFVPLLAPGYFILILFLRQFPRFWPDFLILSCWCIGIAMQAWWAGPWAKHLMPFYWPIQGGALLSWLAYRYWMYRKQKTAVLTSATTLPKAA